MFHFFFSLFLSTWCFCPSRFSNSSMFHLGKALSFFFRRKNQSWLWTHTQALAAILRRVSACTRARRAKRARAFDQRSFIADTGRTKTISTTFRLIKDQIGSWRPWPVHFWAGLGRQSWPVHCWAGLKMIKDQSGYIWQINCEIWNCPRRQFSKKPEVASWVWELFVPFHSSASESVGEVARVQVRTGICVRQTPKVSSLQLVWTSWQTYDFKSFGDRQTEPERMKHCGPTRVGANAFYALVTWDPCQE